MYTLLDFRLCNNNRLERKSNKKLICKIFQSYIVKLVLIKLLFSKLFGLK